ncbi:aminotransferase class III-fold pyridoxal phosphate-dependent enzyme [Nakamurella sp. YIM 132087]|uniref:Aminotransferase class III-fold pyridoxal phosphate-dependent enzyme n=1 Tax=Nakamurella alba TaxID=2665158 RepID=A0A7K1FN83_9ACTN|nr:transaminase [Nakamurella alba]MTD15540.1 aminotransferase class III-fold pyridoxal phosphate-dependent enzyme [Nakamurella alba]
MGALDRDRLRQLTRREDARFLATHVRSGELSRSATHLLGGVPMSWMVKWPGAHPVYVESASGAHFTDVDGNSYVDLCLGDTGAMAGHSPAATMAAVRAQLDRGITTMLPSAAALDVSAELARHFGLPSWQFTLTATDANRHALRYARALTGRGKVVVHDWCYHGSVDETFAVLDGSGATIDRPSSIGPAVPVGVTTVVVEFNDLAGLETALATGEIAAVLMEPALTNIGIVLPDPGYLAGVRELTRKYGTLLIIDETHTLCAGPGGSTAAEGLEPDVLVVGKSIGGGIPCAAFGLSAEVAARIERLVRLEDIDVGGIGGTLAGNPLSSAAMAATLREVLTDDAFGRMTDLAVRWTAGVQAAIDEVGAPWHVTRLGCRAEYGFSRDLPRNGAEAAASDDFELQQYVHLYALNRGFLLTPFHNMALMCPATTGADVDAHTEMFGPMMQELFA